MYSVFTVLIVAFFNFHHDPHGGVEMFCGDRRCVRMSAILTFRNVPKFLLQICFLQLCRRRQKQCKKIIEIPSRLLLPPTWSSISSQMFQRVSTCTLKTAYPPSQYTVSANWQQSSKCWAVIFWPFVCGLQLVLNDTEYVVLSLRVSSWDCSRSDRQGVMSQRPGVHSITVRHFP